MVLLHTTHKEVPSIYYLHKNGRYLSPSHPNYTPEKPFHSLYSDLFLTLHSPFFSLLPYRLLFLFFRSTPPLRVRKDGKQDQLRQRSVIQTPAESYQRWHVLLPCLAFSIWKGQSMDKQLYVGIHSTGFDGPNGLFLC